ncbi:MAG TPA: UDP-N-acetylglucosamine 2-epimerase (non-hydrolyzing), partial [Firmicutes bacterium]|nr:UDP-N-acetylglucosamine 2-epimerase (non-hydrolyzing) [Bacillota bacterium]
AGALAAAKLHIPVAHVEAGLRSFNRRMPEEINRIVADHVASLLLVPTKTALDNLRREGIDDNLIRLVGDVMYDATIHFGQVAQERSTILKELQLTSGGYLLATVHRAENTDNLERLRAIFTALCTIAQKLPVVLPLHPRTRAVLEKAGLMTEVTSSLCITAPLGYLDMLMLERNAALIATDSGGVQKEAFFSRVPCVTLRDETEWVELVAAGWNRLAPPTSTENIVEAVKAALASGKVMPKPDDIYGRGDAAWRIVEALAELKK